MNRIFNLTPEQQAELDAKGVASFKLTPEQQAAFKELAKVKPGDKVVIITDHPPLHTPFFESGELDRKLLTKRLIFGLPENTVVVSNDCHATEWKLSGDINAIWKQIKLARADGRMCSICRTPDALENVRQWHAYLMRKIHGPAHN